MSSETVNRRPGGLALGALVFGAGIGALATEITASRLLAPYFGSSTIVWANLIGIVLAALALGYWLGGRVADRRPRTTLLGVIVLASSISVAAIPFVAEPFLDLTVEGLDDASAGAVIGSFIAVLLLFAPPVVLLGMVSPFAIRLAVSSIETAGAVAGRLYALSTAGSLLGTFLPALILIPAIGTQRTFLVIAALLAASACFLLGVRYLVVAAVLAALVVLPPGAIKAERGLLHEETSYHQYIQVVERSDGRRVLHLNEGVAVHSVWQPGENVLTGGVWDAFLALPPLLGRPLERVAILGNAAGTTARALGVYYPDADIDGVELDPAVSRVGRRFFGLEDNPRLTVHDADARPFLRRTDNRYDLIIVDAYHQPYVPFYLATREFFRLVRERLTPGGIVALNVAAVPGDRRLVDGIGRTVAAELSQVLQWPALRFNTLVLGLTQPLAAQEFQRRLANGPADVASLRQLLARDVRALTASGRPWTDDRAPVEWITDRMIIAYAAEGGRLDEDSLPTGRPAP
ncbi:MAG: fused MFS/spermidine synthase [Actinobacteria bacterium]|nr:fused MFS/spermidine synthase [Actinomycetota bacterium]